MPLICYTDCNFSPGSTALIQKANEIIRELRAQGYELTLRQLYYQFVARGLIPNKQEEYKRLGSVINNARLAGLIDWNSITDRTRDFTKNNHWESPAEIIDAVAKQFQFDKWEKQHYRPEVWVEKDAMEGVIATACKPLDVGYFSCRGYSSQTSIWEAAQRLISHINNGQTPVIVHLGDHDPSGIDMTRDIRDRLDMFVTHEELEAVEVRRIALTMEQVRQHNPPPNPAKLTDSRADDYIAKHGSSSWELDALNPQVIDRLIRSTIEELRNDDLWEEAVAKEQEARRQLQAVSNRWDDVSEFVSKKKKK